MANVLQKAVVKTPAALHALASLFHCTSPGHTHEHKHATADDHVHATDDDHVRTPLPWQRETSPPHAPAASRFGATNGAGAARWRGAASMRTRPAQRVFPTARRGGGGSRRLRRSNSFGRRMCEGIAVPDVIRVFFLKICVCVLQLQIRQNLNGCAEGKKFCITGNKFLTVVLLSTMVVRGTQLSHDIYCSNATIF